MNERLQPEAVQTDQAAGPVQVIREQDWEQLLQQQQQKEQNEYSFLYWR